VIDAGINGKVVLVTGANHSIGAATAKRLSTQGAGVFVADYVSDSPYPERELDEARRAVVAGDRLIQAMRQKSGEIGCRVHSR